MCFYVPLPKYFSLNIAITRALAKNTECVASRLHGGPSLPLHKNAQSPKCVSGNADEDIYGGIDDISKPCLTYKHLFNEKTNNQKY